MNSAKNTIPISIDGNLQPQAIELEEVVLGAMLLEKEILIVIIDILAPAAFYKPAHQSIYRAITMLFNENSPVDLLTVTAQLRKNGELDISGGAYYISQLTNRVASSANAEYHARIILQKFIAREVIRICINTTKESFDDATDIFELRDLHISAIEAIADSSKSTEVVYIGEAHKEALKRLRAINKGEILPGVYTGFPNLQKITGGWQKSNLIILAARPGMGKTALMLQFALKPALEMNIPVAIFSLEMPTRELINRYHSIITGFSATGLSRGTATNSDIDSIELATKCLLNTPIYIDETPALSLVEFKKRARKLHREKKIQMICIDYLQLMTNPIKGGIREQEISGITRGLKEIAKSLDIPIIALSQLSRKCEERPNKRPLLSDLRESGAIEQDADSVYFIYRDEYYNATNPVFEDNSSANGMAELIRAKERGGATGTTILGWEGRQMKFYDLEPGNDPQPISPNTDFIEQTQDIHR